MKTANINLDTMYTIKTRATFCVWLAQNGYLTEKATKFAYKHHLVTE